MFTIDEQYVPLFYALFVALMLGLVIWSMRRMFFLRSRLGEAFQALADREDFNNAKLMPLQAFSNASFSQIKLPNYTLTRSSVFFVQKTRIQLTVKDKSASLLHFSAFFEHRLLQQPIGLVSLKTSSHDITLQFQYEKGEEIAQVIVNQEHFGHIRLAVQALPFPVADTLLFDHHGEQVGKWICQLKPREELTLGEIRYGEVMLHNDVIAKMLAFNPKRWGKGTLQSIFDLLNLSIYPDSPNYHYHRGAPYFKEVTSDLTSEQENWLLVLTALLLYKDAWQPPGKRRVRTLDVS